jgi:antitoxin component of RelBE/YafQ-DinJ toxin-antitoxin module
MTKIDGRRKNKWLQVRMEGHERDVLDEMAHEYGMVASQFVMMAVWHVANTRPILTISPIATAADEQRFADRKERGYLQMRIGAEERALLESVAADYDLDISKAVRVILGYFRATKPRLQIAPQGKDLALALA